MCAWGRGETSSRRLNRLRQLFVTGRLCLRLLVALQKPRQHSDERRLSRTVLAWPRVEQRRAICKICCSHVTLIINQIFSYTHIERDMQADKRTDRQFHHDNERYMTIVEEERLYSSRRKKLQHDIGLHGCGYIRAVKHGITRQPSVEWQTYYSFIYLFVTH